MDELAKDVTIHTQNDPIALITNFVLANSGIIGTLIVVALIALFLKVLWANKVTFAIMMVALGVFLATTYVQNR